MYLLSHRHSNIDEHISADRMFEQSCEQLPGVKEGVALVEVILAAVTAHLELGPGS